MLCKLLKDSVKAATLGEGLAQKTNRSCWPASNLADIGKPYS